MSAQRIIHLVRHGQYNPSGLAPDRLGCGLTELGREQARRAAERLAALPIKVIHHSSLRRASQTAAIIAAATLRPTAPAEVSAAPANDRAAVPLRPSRLLWECIPCVPPDRAEAFSRYAAADLAREQARAERAFARFFRAAPATRARVRLPDGDRHEVVVCHGNIIRYFVCRALSIGPENWMNTDIHHCGICEIVVHADGRAMLSSHNDTGHLPYELRTYA